MKVTVVCRAQMYCCALTIFTVRFTLESALLKFCGKTMDFACEIVTRMPAAMYRIRHISVGQK